MLGKKRQADDLYELNSILSTQGQPTSRNASDSSNNQILMAIITTY